MRAVGNELLGWWSCRDYNGDASGRRSGDWYRNGGRCGPRCGNDGKNPSNPSGLWPRGSALSPARANAGRVCRKLSRNYSLRPTKRCRNLDPSFWYVLIAACKKTSHICATLLPSRAAIASKLSFKSERTLKLNLVSFAIGANSTTPMHAAFLAVHSLTTLDLMCHPMGDICSHWMRSDVTKFHSAKH